MNFLRGHEFLGYLHLKFKAMKFKHLLFLIVIINLYTFNYLFAQTDIATARQQGIGATVTVSGVVTNGTELGIIRYFQDNTGGIAAYGTQLAGLTRGDSLTISGTLFDYNGLLEIQPVTVFTVHSSGNTVPAPTLINATQVDETNESELVRLNGITFQAGGQVIAGNTSYTASDAFGTFSIYIRNGSAMIGQLLPVGAIDLVGISSQYLTNYQVIPRDYNDFIIPPAIQIISPISVSNIVTDGFKLSWLTDSLGSSEVQYGLTPNLEIGYATGPSNTTTHEVTLTGLNPADIVYARCFSVHGIDTAFSNIGVYATQSLSTGNIISYFNHSVNNTVAINQNATQLFEAIDDTLIAYIDRAVETLDITIYDFNNTNISSISNAIDAAYNRGVDVRVISDGSLAASNSGITDLLPNIPRIASPTGGIYGIMHNKFVIIDAYNADPNKAIVWTGATNWQEGQINHDPNNVIIIQDQSLAKAYTLEFNEMWGDNGSIPNLLNSKFGPDKTDNTPHEFNVNGKRVESYFSPSDNVNNKLISTINTADNSIYFASMVITRFDVAQAITNKVTNGVNAYGLTHSISGTLTWNNLTAGMAPGHMLAYADTANSIMHHKYVIIDQENLFSDPQLWTGSHNWSSNANTRNDENTVVVHDQNTANQFYQEFHARFIENGGNIITANKSSFAPTQVQIFPNPNDGGLLQLYVEKTIINCAVNIFNLQGKLIKSSIISTIANTQQYALDISSLSKGTYLIEIQTEQGKEVKRLIKI